MMWTAVNVEMPPEGLRCLVYAPADRRAQQPELMAVMAWTKLRGWWPGEGNRVTHWTPLPAAPDGDR